MLDKTPLARFGKDLETVKAALEHEFAAFERFPVELAAVWFLPCAPEKWSPAQVTEHVMKVNVGMSKTLHLLRRDAPLPEQKRTAGVFVEGRAQAPEFSRPGKGLLWAELLPKWLETKTRFLAEAEQIEASQRTWFHPYFGDLDALGWVQAAAFHMAHHCEQLSGR